MKIFCASNGRCGTRFASQVFDALTDIPSFHEPGPRCINVVNKNVNNHNGEIHPKVQKVLDCKIATIKNSSLGGNYFESSHMFMKSFVADVVRAFPDDVYCIYIERDIIGSTISRTRRGEMERWATDCFLQAHWKYNLLRMPGPLPFFATVAWNQFETRARFEKWRPYFKKTFILDFAKINDAAEWQKLFDEFEIKTKNFRRLPDGLHKNQSGITDDIYPTMIKHVAENWSQPGEFRYMTDLQKLGIDKTPWPDRNYEL